MILSHPLILCAHVPKVISLLALFFVLKASSIIVTVRGQFVLAEHDGSHVMSESQYAEEVQRNWQLIDNFC